ncbi:hypothetical protein KDU71_21825 [Carboxylicivirga sediminis]|uniref:beta-galactosidase n=1 Tax=Carboxylicivirga sediminis TaxID=2006564 RepID=A0A941F793_9BACT|nr:glycoside hydrolase family 2 TIM barrel-domain containing protein [Carboxylicivirga sediminis]MBR8538226.1 hypothetical protein [Carboxylicivirga sediminis]
MQKKLLIAFLVSIWSVGLFAQYHFDTAKLKTIRWSPMPDVVKGEKVKKILLDGQWSFSTSPHKEFWKEHSQKGWPLITVPGEWVMQGFDVEPGKAAGYHRNFNVPANWNDFRIKLKCEAVYSDCDIWLNGKRVGKHIGGFTPFEMDVTNAMKTGENTIALAVRSESLADTLSGASQYAVHPLGGISRSISLVAYPDLNLASLHVSTVFDSLYTDATLTSHLKVANESDLTQTADVKLVLKDNNGKVVMESTHSSGISLKAGEVRNIDLKMQVVAPMKWEPEHPHLYWLECALIQNGKESSVTKRRFGFRQVGVRGNQMFVNNQPVKLRGVNRHDVDPLRGRSLSGNQWYEDVKLFKEANVNYIRTSHYPPHEKLLEACDELGMFVEEEAPFCWAGKQPVSNANYFEAILLPTLEMVERDKSHPCIIHWSIGNESYDFNELFKQSADLVKEADPSRPRIFSQYGEDSDSGYLELGNHHYPGSSGPLKYKDNRRPVTFDEYCHLNAYNRYELMTDPGVRDAWGEILLNMWEEMMASKGVLGGAIWAGIDDTFFLPSGHVVGYGTWGPVDGWRRTKPEYWHMKKVYSPVKLKRLTTEPNQPVKFEVENRYCYSNLSECHFVWKTESGEGVVQPNVKPGEKGTFVLPVHNEEVQKLTVEIWKDLDSPVDKYVYNNKPSDLSKLPVKKDKFKWQSEGDFQAGKSKNTTIQIGTDKLVVADAEGRVLLDEWPGLMLVPFNSGGDTQMTKETPEYELYSPMATNRQILSIDVVRSVADVEIVLHDAYNEAIGKTRILVTANGQITVDYEYKLLKNQNLRQWGMAFRLPATIDRLNWQRKGLWSVYPEDHISRLEGTAQLFYNHPECGTAGPNEKPDYPYSEDQTPYGSNDFRSTKRNVLQATLFNTHNSGIQLHSSGLQHLRCWYHNERVNMLVAEYDNPGAERFLRRFVNHAALFDIPLKKEQTIRGKINLNILNESNNGD